MSTDNYSDELRKIVTVCAGAWSGRHYDDGDTETLALLFCDRKRSLTRQEQTALMLHEDVQYLFSDFYYGMEIEFEGSGSRWHWRERKTVEEGPRMFYIVGGAQGLYPLRGDTEKPFFLFREGRLYETTMEAVHDRCKLMQKFSGDGFDCVCSWQGNKCVHVWHTPGAIASQFNDTQTSFDFMKEQQFLPPTEWMEAHTTVIDKDAWDEHKQTYRLKHWKSQFAGHVLIPPTATAGSPLEPKTKAIRLPFHSNFAHLEQVRDDFSARTQAGVNTRRTINKECRKCYFGREFQYYGQGKKNVTPCTKWNPKYCKHGAWTQERLVDYTLECFERTLKARGQFSLQDMWVVAQLSGIPFKLRAAQTNRLREWHICRIEDGGYGRPDPNHVRVLAARTARDARDNTLPFSSMDELHEFLPPFMREQMQEFRKKPVDRQQFAIWAHLATLSSWKSHTGFFNSDHGCGFTSYQARIGAVFLVENGGVRVQKLWSKSENYNTYWEFDSVYSAAECLMLFQITDAEEDDCTPSLNHWLR